MQPLQTVAGIVKYTFMVVLCVIEVACICQYLTDWILKFTSTLLRYIAMYLDTYNGIFCWWRQRVLPWLCSSYLILKWVRLRLNSSRNSWSPPGFGSAVSCIYSGFGDASLAGKRRFLFLVILVQSPRSSWFIFHHLFSSLLPPFNHHGY